MKKCSKCGECKTPDGFYKNRAMSDGLQHYCKSCQIKANRVTRHRHPETHREAIRRQERNHPGRDRNGSSIQKRATNTVRRAVQRGDLIRPSSCSECGTSDSPIQAHHHDYSLPLEVIWVCARCHGRIHAEMKGVFAA